VDEIHSTNSDASGAFVTEPARRHMIHFMLRMLWLGDTVQHHSASKSRVSALAMLRFARDMRLADRWNPALHVGNSSRSVDSGQLCGHARAIDRHYTGFALVHR